MSSEKQPSIGRLKNYLLLYKTKSGTPQAWCIRSGQPFEDVPYQLKLAPIDWLDSPEGKQFIKDERSRDQQIEISQVMMNISPDILAKYRLYLWTEIDEIIDLDKEVISLPHGKDR